MDPEETAAEPAGEPTSSARSALGSGVLYCDNCGKDTPHRLLRVKPSVGAARTHVTGVARCRVCRFTHPFTSVRVAPVEVALIVSEGHQSGRRRLELPPASVLQVGSPIPDVPETLRVTKLDARDGRAVGAARASEVATVWAVRGDEAAVPVSIVVGARTTSRMLRVPPSTRLAVGETLDVEGDRIAIVGLRARGHTWRLEGDAFEAAEVQRVYGRRMLSPPAGNSDWRSDRERPRSRASSTSFAARSRSSPGVRRTATVPRAATAGGGAATHRSSVS